MFPIENLAGHFAAERLIKYSITIWIWTGRRIFIGFKFLYKCPNVTKNTHFYLFDVALREADVSDEAPSSEHDEEEQEAEDVGAGSALDRTREVRTELELPTELVVVVRMVRQVLVQDPRAAHVVGGCGFSSTHFVLVFVRQNNRSSFCLAVNNEEGSGSHERTLKKQFQFSTLHISMN